MPPNKTIPITPVMVKAYLDGCIEHWRERRRTLDTHNLNDLTEEQVICYIDAYQSMRSSLFGETKPL